MEEIQFFNYIFSILAFLLAAFAVWNSFKQESCVEWQIKDLRDQIRTLRELKESSNERRKY